MRFTALDLLLAGLTGGGVGFLSGLFGIGGGFLLVPVLNILLRVPIELAVGAGVCQVLGPATTSLLARHVSIRQTRLPLIMAGGLFVGVLAGAQLFESARRQGRISMAGTSVPLADLVVLTIYLVLMLGVGGFALWEARRQQIGRAFPRGWLAGWHVPPCADFAEFDSPQVSIPVIAWFGLAVGLLSGLLGMSGGLVLLPGLVYLLGMRTQQAILSSMVIVWLVSFQATVAHAWHENIDLTLVATLLVGGTLGARLGAELGLKLAGRQLRRAFGWLLLATAALIAARLVRLWI